ncbi:MAG: MBL fold metallo-hydrolase [Parvibaculum sp.]
MKKFAAILVALAAILGVAYYFLFLQMGSADRELYSINLDEIRHLATAQPGALPTAINAEAPVTFDFPGAAVVTGWAWAANPMVIYAYEVEYPDGHIMIDTSLSKEQAAVMAGDDVPYDMDAYNRLMSAVGSAKQIVFTHEHGDHLGGVVSHPDALSILDRVRFTERQLSDLSKWGGVEYPEGALDNYEPLAYDTLHALAPGIVLIEAAGHTPGSQIIYVQRADGQEYFFVGDVAWNYANIDLVRPRPNAVSLGFLGEDRPRTQSQLAALKELSEANPAIAVVVGHDGPRTRAQIVAGLLGDRIE